MRRALLTVLHVWGYWTVVLLAAGLASGDAPLLIAGAGALVWLAGLGWAARQRSPSLVPRAAGLFTVALAAYGCSALSPGSVDYARMEIPQERWTTTALTLFGGMIVIAVLAVASLGVALLLSRVAGDPGSPPRRPWLRRAVAWPLAVLVTALLTQANTQLTGLALSVWGLLWMQRLLRESRQGESVRPRLAGLFATFAVLAAWPPAPVDTDQVAEAVFRREIGGRGLYFLSVDDADPSDAMLARLGSGATRALPRSVARLPDWEKGERGGATDPATGEHGVCYYVSNVRRSWTNPCAVAVSFRSWGGPLAGHGSTFWVVWLGGRWVVVQEAIHWVS